MGTSSSAVRVHLLRARRRLAKLLADTEVETLHE
jgi:DNA-directed RNA polymerase specialized sigma24 family protein